MEQFFQAIPNLLEVKTIIPLIAVLFTGTLTFLFNRNRDQLKKSHQLIESAPEEERSALIEQVLDKWGLSAKNFSQAKQFELIKQLERQKEKRFYFSLSLSFILLVLAGILIFTTSSGVSDTSLKKIVLMDSPIKDVVYDYEGYKLGRTNADEITAILDDIDGLNVIKENTSLVWEREEEVLRFSPDLIVIHISCFYDHTNVQDADRKFYSFLEYISEIDSKILIYSRGFHHEEIWLDNLYRDIPNLQGKVDLLKVEQGKNFSNAVIRRALKSKVKKLLDS